MKNHKDFHLLFAVVFSGAAIIVPATMLLMAQEHNREYFAASVSGLFLLGFAAYHWFKHERTPETEVFDRIEDKPPEEQIRLAWWAIIVLPICGGVASYFMYSDLAALEAGEVESIEVWIPIAAAYQFLGFWPAVLSLPLLCLVGFVQYLNILRKARHLLKSNPTSASPQSKTQ